MSEKALVPGGAGNGELSITSQPELILQLAQRASKSLQSVISGKKKKIVINNKQYLEFEDWQTLGEFFGVSVRTFDAQPVVINGIDGAKARAEIVSRDGIVLGGAEAYCLKDEDRWKKAPWFQIASMAQTRAGSKALRNKLSWVAVLAGYGGTPAEEMDGVKNNPPAAGGGSGSKSPRKISEAQGKRFWAKCRGTGKSNDTVKAYLGTLKIDSIKDITTDIYDDLCLWADQKE